MKTAKKKSFVTKLRKKIGKPIVKLTKKKSDAHKKIARKASLKKLGAKKNKK